MSVVARLLLPVEELGVPEDISDRIDNNGYVGRLELNIAARDAINNRTNHILPAETASYAIM